MYLEKVVQQAKKLKKRSDSVDSLMHMVSLEESEGCIDGENTEAEIEPPNRQVNLVI